MWNRLSKLTPFNLFFWKSVWICVPVPWVSFHWHTSNSLLQFVKFSFLLKPLPGRSIEVQYASNYLLILFMVETGTSRSQEMEFWPWDSVATSLWLISLDVSMDSVFYAYSGTSKSFSLSEWFSDIFCYTGRSEFISNVKVLRGTIFLFCRFLFCPVLQQC